MEKSNIVSSQLEKIEAILSKHGQAHVLQFWDELHESQRESLIGQILELDLELVARLFNSTNEVEQWAELAAKADVPPAITLEDLADQDAHREAVRLGGEAISSGQVAMILVAGGQGSRLGFHHPKGMFPIGPISNRSLYQMHIDLLRARAAQFGSRIPLYVMSSPPTHDETVSFLARHQNFGLDAEDLTVFCQGTMPAVDTRGRLLLEDHGRIFVSPDGHGGTLAALVKNGCLQDMIDRGIEYVFYAQVDNPLVQICHPALVGYHVQHQSEMTSQVVRKNQPLQKVGNVVKVDGEVRIIEYSDLPQAQACQTNPDGSLRLWAGSIAVHVFDLKFLVRCSQHPDSLPFHRAFKQVPFIDSNGKLVVPEQPNAIKFERFVFDLLPAAKNAIVCEVDPAEGFCAVKNSPPAESETPAHVKQAILDLHARWLTLAGIEVEPGVPVEINPLFAIDAAQLAQSWPQGKKITTPTYLQSL